MFRKMRRAKQQLPEAECIGILEQGSHGVLAVMGEGGYPYGVPLSYVYAGGKLYFHCAVEGHKLDAVRGCDKASFTVVERDDVVAERFTTRYRSVIVFGRAKILTAPEEVREALRTLAEKYSPHAHNTETEIAGALARTAIIELTPEQITGKESRELAETRGQN